MQGLMGEDVQHLIFFTNKQQSEFSIDNVREIALPFFMSYLFSFLELSPEELKILGTLVSDFSAINNHILHDAVHRLSTDEGISQALDELKELALRDRINPETGKDHATVN